MRKVFVFLLLVIVVGGIARYAMTHSQWCVRNEKFYHKKIGGKVTYIRHDYDSIKSMPLPDLLIVNFDHDSIHFLNLGKALDFDFSAGDSFVKDAGSFTFEVFRHDSLVFKTADDYEADCSYCK